MKESNTENLILKAAEEEFQTKGFAGATTTSIAERAGVTHTMLHYYFRTKKNIFYRIFEEKIKLLSQLLTDIFSNKNMPLSARLELLINKHFELLQNNPMLPWFIVNEIVSSPERTSILQNKMRSIISRHLPTLQHELDTLASQKQIEKISASDLFIDILLLNVSLFIYMPIFKNIFPEETANEDKFLNARKQENIRLIIARLKLHEQ